MSAVKPANMFCCGCSLRFGTQFIATVHLIYCVAYICNASSNIIFRIPGMGFDVNLVEQTLCAAWCLIGLPFIMAALWGVASRLEVHVRVYVFYLAATLVVDTLFLIYFFFIQDACTMLPRALKASGTAFACGIARLIAVHFFFFSIAVQAYAVYIVWSFCEDLRTGGCGFGFGDLTSVEEAKSDRRAPVHADALHADYGSISVPNYAAPTTIFSGSYHETNYPPKQDW
mmetsp:Transcript_30010/g.72050  ORF Transcript_30010/g.72050 Transcript_30010/m.72050 type:complete len:229 (+) Transcript_30010:79-765(+)